MIRTLILLFSFIVVFKYGNAQLFFHTSASADASKLIGGISMSSTKPLHEVNARLIDKRSGETVRGIRAYLSVPGKNFEFRTAVSDENGLLHFLLTDIDVAKPLLFQTDGSIDSLYRIEPQDPFATATDAPARLNDTLAFYGRADKTYLLDDYTRFPTMEEILIEYVPEVKLIKTRNTVRFEVSNDPFKVFFETDPLVLIDGVPAFDLKKLMAIDPLKIKKLEVMNRKYYYGSLACNGIVSFTSYEGDLGGYQPGENATVAIYHK